MAIKIYDTLTRQKKAFDPVKKDSVGLYVCGPTVYDEPHIGHARSAYVFDVIRRYFIYKKYKVTFVRNVTDVDDKIINKAKEGLKDEDLNSAVRRIADKYLKSYHNYMEALNIMPPDREPRATEYIGKMKDFISLLISRGMAYESAGDVYFDIKKAKGYGKLSNQSLEMLESGARISPGENKKDPLDFALWKKAKDNEPSWPSPWGEGRPGWHIECSVMSSDILGDEFDIHGGGLDLIFPHHENEIAQSEGAGKKFARYWMHNGLLTIKKEKMSKSTGNFITVKETLKRYSPDTLKMLFLGAHYSHPVDFSWERMEEADSACERVGALMARLKKITTSGQAGAEGLKFRERFEEAMDDDFNMPKGLAVLFDTVSACNKLLDDKDSSGSLPPRSYIDTLKDITAVFGLTFEKKEKKLPMPEKDLREKIDLRNKARREKDFVTADNIRKELEKKGVILKDLKSGATEWEYNV